MVHPVHLSGSLCVVMEHTRVLVVECLTGSPSSTKWFAVCSFGTHVSEWWNV